MLEKSQIAKKEITLLYVEDEEFIRNELTSVFEMIAHKVIVATDGQEGFEAFKKNDVDLIITDINMPNMNGFEMLKAIREIRSDVPAIILSAYSQSDFIRKANEIDSINEYLIKPVDISLLLNKINKIIQKVEAKRAHKELVKLLEQYKLAVDSSSIVSKTDSKGIITYVNDVFCEISGYSKKELLGKNHNILRHPDMPKETFKELWTTIKTEKKLWQGKIKNRTKEGGYYIVEATIVPILNEEGEVQEYIAMRYDITELEAYKELLEGQVATSQDSLQSKVHTIKEYEKIMDLSMGQIRIALNGDILFINEQMQTILQMRQDQAVQTTFNELFEKESFDDITTQIKKEDFFKGTIKGTNKQGEKFFLDMTLRAIHSLDGITTQYLGMAKDITPTILLHQEIEDTQKDVIFSLGTIGEARSKETGNHVKRVAEYSYLLAKKLNLSEAEAQLIRMASPMHDIGKVGIPDAILNKPGKLTAEEWNLMQTHATIGYEMLKNSNREILKASAVVAHEHHEKWNGKGYPRGLKAEEIHIFGRITAVADVFDALGSDRCYKKAWPLEKILRMFEEEKAEHFDPKVIEVFFDNLDEFLAIRDTYNDEYVDEEELEALR
ncbi:HD domain-containing phosphohydrolase [Candidatus Marinarcus aquaticus]|uniref:Regulator n=1 Tax=Candidatus Marinarcus aquaticus TaxID=2044504 RepID=A0A4Q0XVB3_9BACT|nr:HD domain-containing phosphohydrolase [Candidatus Marinarcus aquaticus]RXJ60524.1 regulator [Candidatus Marinarcus aquaticus]